MLHFPISTSVVRMISGEGAVLLVDPALDARSPLIVRIAEHGFTVYLASTLSDARQIVDTQNIAFAMTEMIIADGCASDVIEIVLAGNPLCRVIVHSRFCNISNAVALVKAGASDVLPKPADTDFLVAILLGRSLATEEIGEIVGDPMQLRVDYIHQIYDSCNRSCTKAAQKLSMDRRTLYRLLKRTAQVGAGSPSGTGF